jgi:hypothetical protein
MGLVRTAIILVYIGAKVAEQRLPRTRETPFLLKTITNTLRGKGVFAGS